MRGAALLALSLCAGLPVRAEDLWSVSSGANGIAVSTDASTLACEHGECSVWERTKYAEPRPDGAVSLKDLVSYDCAGLRTRTQVEIRYRADGKVLATTTATQANWLAVQPDTVGGDTLAFACIFLTLGPTEVATGLVNAEGHRY